MTTVWPTNGAGAHPMVLCREPSCRVAISGTTRYLKRLFVVRSNVHGCMGGWVTRLVTPMGPRRDGWDARRRRRDTPPPSMGVRCNSGADVEEVASLPVAVECRVGLSGGRGRPDGQRRAARASGVVAAAGSVNSRAVLSPSQSPTKQLPHQLWGTWPWGMGGAEGGPNGGLQSDRRLLQWGMGWRGASWASAVPGMGGHSEEAATDSLLCPRVTP